MPSLKRAIGFIVSLAILAVPVIAWAKQDSLIDWWKLRGYTPPATITRLADEDTMTSSARHLFYINHPQLIGDASSFHQACPQSEQTIVLGCYHAIENGIDAYNIQDDRLQGVQEVTAAHEMLHAAYDRLSADDKNLIGGLLDYYYVHNLHDQRIIDTINLYKQTEPKDVMNEMHSVFGTEATNLPQPLEDYYKRYFTNRAAVTQFAANYQHEFSNRTSQINVDDQQLVAMKKQIQAEEQSLQNQLSQLEADRARLDSLRSSGQTDAYNAAVPGFNSEVVTYNPGVTKLRQDISAYNQLVTQRNAIANELRSLDSSIDTRLTTQSAQ